MDFSLHGAAISAVAYDISTEERYVGAVVIRTKCTDVPMVYAVLCHKQYKCIAERLKDGSIDLRILIQPTTISPDRHCQRIYAVVILVKDDISNRLDALERHVAPDNRVVPKVDLLMAETKKIKEEINMRMVTMRSENTAQLDDFSNRIDILADEINRAHARLDALGPSMCAIV